MTNFRLCYVDRNYAAFLRSADSRVSWKEGRPFLAYMVQVNGHDYAIPITTKELRDNGKPRNRRTTTSIRYQNTSYGALLHNNMIPVISSVLTDIDIDHQPQREKDILNPKVIFIRRNADEIAAKALRVYDEVAQGKDAFMTGFCCDFKLLEVKCLEYCKLHNLALLELPKQSITDRLAAAKVQCDKQQAEGEATNHEPSSKHKDQGGR